MGTRSKLEAGKAWEMGMRVSWLLPGPLEVLALPEEPHQKIQATMAQQKRSDTVELY